VDRVRVSSIKGTIGHPFGAAGAFQSATAALAIRHALVPPTRNFHRPDPACALRVVGPEPEPLAVAHALVTSYGYGGVNAALVLGAA
jgi:3-oxoacyl-(acyl-carrier-protein) synthase